jgi:hypothetical protein
MEEIRTFALMLVFCAAAGLVYYLLLPSGRVSETAKGVLGAVLLFCVLTPLFSFVNIEMPAFPEVQTENYAENGDLLLAGAERAVRQTVESVVRQFTALPCETEIRMHITEDYGIEIEQVRLIFSAEPEDGETLRQALTQALGAAPEVVIREAD